MKLADIREVHLKPVGGVDVSFSVGRIGNAPWLIMKVCGDYGIGSRGNANGTWMCSMVLAGLVSFPCHGLVLDLTEMTYEMSDSLYGVIVQIRKHRSPRYPVFVMVSARCKDGIVSLMAMTKDASTRVVEHLSEVTNNA
jgi:hypothetical protein